MFADIHFSMFSLGCVALFRSFGFLVAQQFQPRLGCGAAVSLIFSYCVFVFQLCVVRQLFRISISPFSVHRSPFKARQTAYRPATTTPRNPVPLLPLDLLATQTDVDALNEQKHRMQHSNNVHEHLKELPGGIRRGGWIGWGMRNKVSF